MKDDLYRAMLCFAALRLTTSELRRLLLNLRSEPIDQLIQQVKGLSERSRPDGAPTGEIAGVNRRSLTPQQDGSVGQRVERLLRVEAGLSTRDAVKRLTGRLIEEGVLQKGNVPPLSRKALSSWVMRIARVVPEKEILRCATILRNETVHSPTTDWSLRMK